MHGFDNKKFRSISLFFLWFSGFLCFGGCTNENPKIQLLTLTPSIEVCDGEDNNGNGEADEGFSIGLECNRYEVGDGEENCPHISGTLQCKPGDPSKAVCTPNNPDFAPSSNEKCNQRDDDCDERIDEDNACASQNVAQIDCNEEGDELTCEIQCENGYDNCEEDSATDFSCETEVATNRVHCGACGNICQFDCGNGQCSKPVFVDAGDAHTCALFKFVEGAGTLGYVKCWGDNSKGQLGITQTESGPNFTSNPTNVSGQIGQAFNPIVKQLSVGANHTCVLTTATQADGPDEIWCWGNNSAGEVDPDPSSQNMISRPQKITLDQQVRINGMYELVLLSSGRTHSCVHIRDQLEQLTPFNQTICWGSNNSHKLGSANAGHHQVTIASIDRDFRQNASAGYLLETGGEHTCIFARDFVGGNENPGLLCWGEAKNFIGGDMSIFLSSGNSIEQFPGGTIPDVSALSLGNQHTCFKSNGDLYCVGSNECGQLGVEEVPVNGEQFVRVLNELDERLNIRQIASGYQHTCALGNDNEVYCWGNNGHQQLGISMEVILSIFQDTLDNENPSEEERMILEILLSIERAIPQENCWFNFYAPLSVANVIDPDLNLNEDESRIQQITSGKNHVCVLLGNGDIRCWGNNACGQLGTSENNAPGRNCDEDIPIFSNFEPQSVDFEGN